MANIESDWIKFLDVSYDGIIIADEEGRIIYMNPASEKLEEVNKEFIIGRYARDLEKEGIYEVSATVKVLKTKTPVTVTQKKGDKELVITGIPIFEDGRIKWVFINERDVTELNRQKKLAYKYQSELKKIKDELNGSEIFVARSNAMQKVKSLLDRIVHTDMTILLEGESGVGKDVLARWIHRNSKRNQNDFIKIDCSSLPGNLLESELFGYEKGAFTGASKVGKKGLVEIADKGTLFLDEIGELPLRLQAKLLRLIQKQIFLPIGSVQNRKVNIRIIAATNRNLQSMVKEKLFREDLYYRLNVIPIKVPPLRKRNEDLFHFIQFFLNAYNKKYGFKKKISNKAINILHGYQWPGNLRELSNIMERLVVVTDKGCIEAEDVISIVPLDSDTSVNLCTNYQSALDAFEKKYILKVLRGGKTIKELSGLLGLSESTVKRKLKKYKIRQKDRVECDP